MPSPSRARNAWERMLAAAGTPAFLLSPQRRVLAWNAGCELLTGWSATELLGELVNYASVADFSTLEAVLNSLCPPAEVFAGDSAEIPIFLATHDGETLPRLVQYHAIRDAHDALIGILGLLLPLPPAHQTPAVSPLLQLHAELASARKQIRERSHIRTVVCRSPAMLRVLQQLELAQQSLVPVYLQGETGTGREHLARIIHFGGPRHNNWFVPLDCRKLAADELERVLHRLLDVHRDTSDTAGRPQPGTLYLADVDFLPRDLQELLVQNFSPGPGNLTSLRLMASGRQSLATAVAAEQFLSELEALLTPLTITLPPLRERGAELPLLAQHFLEELNRQGKQQLNGFAAETLHLLQQYRWPGNLDELQQVIRAAQSQAREATLLPADLPHRFRTGLEHQSLPPPVETRPLRLEETLQQLETTLIQQALERNRHNKTKAAEQLGINRARLYRRMEQLGIEDLEPGEGPAAPVTPDV